MKQYKNTFRCLTLLWQLITIFFNWLEGCLVSKKDLIQVLAAIVLGTAGFVVSKNSMKISAVQLEIHRAEMKPIFRFEMTNIDNNRVLNIYNENGFAKNFYASVRTYYKMKRYKNSTPIVIDSAMIELNGVYSAYLGQNKFKGYLTSLYGYKSSMYLNSFESSLRTNKTYLYSEDLITAVEISYRDITDHFVLEYYRIGPFGGIAIDNKQYNYWESLAKHTSENLLEVSSLNIDTINKIINHTSLNKF